MYYIYVVGFKEGGYLLRKLQCGDPERRVIFCEIHKNKTKSLHRVILRLLQSTYINSVRMQK